MKQKPHKITVHNQYLIYVNEKKCGNGVQFFKQFLCVMPAFTVGDAREDNVVILSCVENIKDNKEIEAKIRWKKGPEEREEHIR